MAYRWINWHLKGSNAPVTEPELPPIEGQLLRAFPDELPADELNTKIDEVVRADGHECLPRTTGRISGLARRPAGRVAAHGVSSLARGVRSRKTALELGTQSTSRRTRERAGDHDLLEIFPAAGSRGGRQALAGRAGRGRIARRQAGLAGPARRRRTPCCWSLRAAPARRAGRTRRRLRFSVRWRCWAAPWMADRVEDMLAMAARVLGHGQVQRPSGSSPGGARPE